MTHTLRLFVSKRASCAPHYGDNSDKTYDSNGKLCGGLSSEDRMYVAIAGALCGTILLGLGITFLIRRRRRARSKPNDPHQQDMQSAYRAPLLGWGSQHLRQNSYHLELSPTLSSGPPSPYSPNSETFHFPILSADGHLLPPAPASAARSAHLISPVLSERPLPSPPMEGGAFGLRPVSPAEERGGYAPLGMGGDEPVVGLWPAQGGEFEQDIGQANVQPYEYRPHRLSTIMGSPATVHTPRMSPVINYIQPQSATIQHTPSHAYTYDERGALVRDYR